MLLRVWIGQLTGVDAGSGGVRDGAIQVKGVHPVWGERYLHDKDCRGGTSGKEPATTFRLLDRRGPIIGYQLTRSTHDCCRDKWVSPNPSYPVTVSVTNEYQW